MVLLMKDGYEMRVHTLDLALDTSVNLTMRRVSGARLASLSGRITAQYHGIALPVPGAEVVLGSGLGRAVTDKDGRYELRGLAPGYYFGLVRREGYRSRYLDDAAVTELRSGVNERDRVLEFADRGPAIRGIVVGGGGEPVSGGIRVSVVETTPGSTSSRQPAMRVLEGGAVRVESESVTADAGGVVQLEDLPHGERRLRIELANGAVFTNAVYVNGAMETVIAVPDALAAYDEWKGRRFLEAGEWKTRIEQDPDADGFSNWEEFVADTDPTNGGSFPRIAGWTGVGGKSVWIDSCSSGRLYEAQWTTNLLDPCWRRAGLARLGTGSNLVIGVTNAVPGGRCFYRLGVRLP
jgi:hypothetical protein